MNHFPENLSLLRRRAGYTQESLAEAVGVSRQAVSKWESDQAMPEAATLLDLADLLNCSLDTLMREDLSQTAAPDSAESPPAGPGQEEWALFDAYTAHNHRFGLCIAGGVLLALLGVAALLVTYVWLGNSGLAILPLFFFLALAVFLFVYGGMSHSDFFSTHPPIPDLRSPEELQSFRRMFRLGIALAVAGILVDVALLLGFITLSGGRGNLHLLSVALFLAVLGGCVAILVYLGIRASDFEPQTTDPVAEKWSGVIMSAATILFLLLGFVFHKWHPGWVVFPIGGILCGVLELARRK